MYVARERDQHTREAMLFDKSLCFGICGDGTWGSWYYGNSDLDGCGTNGEKDINVKGAPSDTDRCPEPWSYLQVNQLPQARAQRMQDRLAPPCARIVRFRIGNHICDGG